MKVAIGQWRATVQYALLCFTIACSCGSASAPSDDTAPFDAVVVISVGQPHGSDLWASVLPDGMLNLKVPTPASRNWSADLEAHLSFAAQPADGRATENASSIAPPAQRLTVSLDNVEVATCDVPCTVPLDGVRAGAHVVTAGASGGAEQGQVQPLRFRIAGLDEETSGEEGTVYVGGTVQGEEDTRPQHLHAAQPASLAAQFPQGPSDADGSGGSSLDRRTFDPDGRYVALLFPPDDTCFTESSTALYVSAAVTDGFFALPHTHNVIVRFEATVHCILDKHGAPHPAPMDYTPKLHGNLIQCHSYESDFILSDGWVRGPGGTHPAQHGGGQHDCPAGTVCKHDLEDGFMVDIGLVVPQAGQTLKKDLAEGMHIARCFLVNATTHAQLGREAVVTYFVDHGLGRVCNPHPPAVSSEFVGSSSDPAASVLSAVRSPTAGSRSAAATDAAPRAGERGADEGRGGRRRVPGRRLVNVAPRGRAMQSSTAGEAVAALANDGSVVVGLAGAVGEGGRGGRGDGGGGRGGDIGRGVRAARTVAEAAPYWEVELAEAVDVESLAMWAEIQSSGPHGYPAFEVTLSP
jgi:hypothetical protein